VSPVSLPSELVRAMAGGSIENCCFGGFLHLGQKYIIVYTFDPDFYIVL